MASFRWTILRGQQHRLSQSRGHLTSVTFSSFHIVSPQDFAFNENEPISLNSFSIERSTVFPSKFLSLPGVLPIVYNHVTWRLAVITIHLGNNEMFENNKSAFLLFPHEIVRVMFQFFTDWFHRYFPGAGNNVVFRSTYKLPEGLTCSQCVLQWRYFAGNNWGKCPNGTEKVGCGPQEQFFGKLYINNIISNVCNFTAKFA
jgi:hypothetical protein